MQTRHRIGLLAGLVLLLAGPGGPTRPTPAHAATCGTEWSVVPSPNAGSVDDELRGVSAASATDAWAVGRSVDAATFASRTLTEHWDGSGWTVVPSPNRANQGNVLRATAAVSGSDVWAVGASITPVNVSKTLTQRWDGSAWKIVPSPNLSPGNNRLKAVTAVAANDVWAVGVAGLGTLVVHWDGATWSVVASPNPSSSADLAGVAAVSATDIWAVGAYLDDTTQVLRTLVEHWNGTQWEVVASPNVPPSDNRLNAVTALAARQWAVGSYFSELGPVQTLIEQRCA